MADEQRENGWSPEAVGEVVVMRRVVGRLAGSPGVIPRAVTHEFPERVTRLARGRLPLLDALQRRWGQAPGAFWPGAAKLPLVTARKRGAPAEVDALSSDPGAAIRLRSALSERVVMTGGRLGQDLSFADTQPPAVQPSPMMAAAGDRGSPTGSEPAAHEPDAHVGRDDGEGAPVPPDNPTVMIGQHLPIVHVQPASAALEVSSVMRTVVEGSAPVGNDPAHRGSAAHIERHDDRFGPTEPPDNPAVMMERDLPVVRAQPAPAALEMSSAMRTDNERPASVGNEAARYGHLGSVESDYDEDHSAAPPDDSTTMATEQLPIARLQQAFGAAAEPFPTPAIRRGDVSGASEPAGDMRSEKIERLDGGPGNVEMPTRQHLPASLPTDAHVRLHADAPDNSASAINPTTLLQQRFGVVHAQPSHSKQPALVSVTERRKIQTREISAQELNADRATEPGDAIPVSAPNDASTNFARGSVLPVGEQSEGQASHRTSPSGVIRLLGAPIIQRSPDKRRTGEAEPAPARAGWMGGAEDLATTLAISREQTVVVSAESARSIQQTAADTPPAARSRGGAVNASGLTGESPLALIEFQHGPAFEAGTVSGTQRAISRSQPFRDQKDRLVHSTDGAAGSVFTPTILKAGSTVSPDAAVVRTFEPEADPAVGFAASDRTPGRVKLPAVEPFAPEIAASRRDRLPKGLVLRRQSTQRGVLPVSHRSERRDAPANDASPSDHARLEHEVGEVGRPDIMHPTSVVPMTNLRMAVRASRQPQLVWVKSRPTPLTASTPQQPKITAQRQSDTTSASAWGSAPLSHSSPAASGGAQFDSAAPMSGNSSDPGGRERAAEQRVRLDDLETERVANVVIERLRQRLQMEREARGL